MDDRLFHYTSRQLAHETIISGKLRPRYGGKVYLTEDSYEQGANAARRLAIVNKPVEVVFVVPRDRVRDLSPERQVEYILGDDGTILRPGGGTEQYTEEEIDIDGLNVWSLACP